jgi:NodT family efflux transporter outer membrane factor (OMF) lipoprotein
MRFPGSYQYLVYLQRLLFRRNFIFAVVFLCLPGCMMGPNFHSPAAPQTQAYTESPLPAKTVSVHSVGTSGEAQYFAASQDLPAQWWALYHCPALDELIRRGLANSPNLAAAKATLRQAKQNLYAQIGSSLLPSVNALFTGERERFSESAFGIEQAPSSIFNVYNASVNVSYTFDIFGGARREIEALQAQVDYQRFELEAAYLTLTSNIVTTAVTAASIQAQIDATRSLVRSQEAQLTIVKKQFNLGGVSRSDVLAQETQVAQTRALLPPLEQRLVQTRDALAVLVGGFPSEAHLPAIKLNELDLPTNLPLTLPSALVRHRPDIRAQEALLHAASAQIGVATANLFPQLSLTGGYGWTKDTIANLFLAKNNIWNYTGQLLQPVFQGGALLAKRRAAIAGYQQAAAQYRQTVLQSFQNVSDTLKAIENDAKTLQAQKHAEVAARDALNITQQQYQLGGVSYLLLLNAQRQYQQARINLILAQAARYTDTAALFQALGGGWWNRGTNRGTNL